MSAVVTRYNTYMVEIYGENNSFNVEVTAGVEPWEDWLTGRVHYSPFIEKVILLHGERRRDVTKLITDNQAEDIFAEIARQDREVLAEKAVDRYLDRLEGQQWEYEHSRGRFIENAGIC